MKNLMNKQLTVKQRCVRALCAGGLSLALASCLTGATAATMTGGASVSRALPPASAKPGAASIPMPAAMLPDIVADGGGVTIAGRQASFNDSVAINSSAMVPLTPIQQRARSRIGEHACRFVGSFTLKNVGGSSPSSVGVYNFDVYTWVEQPQGPQTGKIRDMGYSIPDMKPGATYPQTFSFDLLPGSYVFWLSIDPYQKLKQATPGVKKYSVKIFAHCGT